MLIAASIAGFIANLFLGLIVFGSGARYPEASAALLLAWVFFCIQFAFMAGNRKLMPLTFSFMIYWGYGFLLPGLYQVRNEDFFWPSRSIDNPYVATASAVALLASFALTLGFILNNSPDVGRKRLSFADSSGGLPSVAATTMVVLGGTGLVALIALAVGPFIFFLPRLALAQLEGLNSTTFGLVIVLTRGIGLGLLAVAAISHTRLRRPLTLMLLILTLCVNFVVNFPLAVPRYYLVAFLFVFSLTLMRGAFQRFRLLAYFGAPILLYLVFPTLGRFNRATEFDFSFTQIDVREYLSHGDLDGFESIMNAALMVSEHGYTYGTRLLSAFFFFVPRAIWSGKQIPTGHDAGGNAGYEFTRVSMPLPGEIYADAGLVLVAVLMFIVGWYMRQFDREFWAARSNVSVAITTLLAGFAPIIFRGSLLSTIQALVCSLFVVAGWHVLSTVFGSAARGGRPAPRRAPRSGHLPASSKEPHS